MSFIHEHQSLDKRIGHPRCASDPPWSSGEGDQKTFVPVARPCLAVLPSSVSAARSVPAGPDPRLHSLSPLPAAAYLVAAVCFVAVLLAAVLVATAPAGVRERRAPCHCRAHPAGWLTLLRLHRWNLLPRRRHKRTPVIVLQVWFSNIRRPSVVALPIEHGVRDV